MLLSLQETAKRNTEEMVKHHKDLCSLSQVEKRTGHGMDHTDAAGFTNSYSQLWHSYSDERN